MPAGTSLIWKLWDGAREGSEDPRGPPRDLLGVPLISTAERLTPHPHPTPALVAVRAALLSGTETACDFKKPRAMLPGDGAGRGRGLRRLPPGERPPGNPDAARSSPHYVGFRGQKSPLFRERRFQV